MLYLVTEYAKNGEIFGELSFQMHCQHNLCVPPSSVSPHTFPVASLLRFKQTSINILAWTRLRALALFPDLHRSRHMMKSETDVLIT